MQRAVAALFLSLCLVLSNNAFAQSGNASVGGFVQDATQAFIPGVTGRLLLRVACRGGVMLFLH